MIRLPDNWLTLTLALTDAEKGRLVDALAALVNGIDAEEWMDGPEMILYPLLADMQKKSKSVQTMSKSEQTECQNSYKSIPGAMQKKSKSEQTEVKRQEERDEKEEKERTKEREEREEREENSYSPPRVVVSELSEYPQDARARGDCGGNGSDESVTTTTTTILEAWNSTPRVPNVRLTPERVRQIDALIERFGADTVVEIFANIRNKPFLLGENKQGWIVMWRWIATPSNFAKVVDGQYDPFPEQDASPASYDIDRAMDRMRTTVPALTKKRR